MLAAGEKSSALSKLMQDTWQKGSISMKPLVEKGDKKNKFMKAPTNIHTMW